MGGFMSSPSPPPAPAPAPAPVAAARPQRQKTPEDTDPASQRRLAEAQSRGRASTLLGGVGDSQTLG